MDSDFIFYDMTMKTLYVTPCDAYTKQFQSHYEAALDMPCIHHIVCP